MTRTPGSESKQSSKVDLHCLDIDSDNVLAILFDLVKELKSKTFVTKTKKDCGYHIYWLSHTQHQAIGRSKCRASYEFEIKSDNSLGLCTLPPSIHRDDPNFKYQSIGAQQKIAINDELYAKLLLLLSDECLTHNNNIGKDKGNGSENSNSNRNEKKSNFSSGHFKTLTDANIEQVISNIKDSYRKGYRDPIIFGLAGLMFKNKIKFQSTKDLEKLCDFTKDEEKSSRLSVVQNTYLNGLEGARSKEQNSF